MFYLKNSLPWTGFYDGELKLKILPGEIVATPVLNKNIEKRIRKGGIIKVTEADYNAYVASKPAKDEQKVEVKVEVTAPQGVQDLAGKIGDAIQSSAPSTPPVEKPVDPNDPNKGEETGTKGTTITSDGVPTKPVEVKGKFPGGKK